MGEIYKIQSSSEETSTGAMLVYNKARNRQTYVHSDSPAFQPVLKLLANEGFQGPNGGAKAFFWGRYIKTDELLYVNAVKLAPFQQW